jgi:predicted nucleic acid-binding protein
LIAIDSSVAVAAFASWHERHADARRALSGDYAIVAHAAVETYSVLTRLPAPHRVAPGVAAEFLRRQFARPWLTLDARSQSELPERLAALGVAGGAVYDALVGLTAAAAGAALASCDERAFRVYELCGVQVQPLP